MVWPSGETAFVTGAASGIGLGIARALVGAGAKVAIADIDAIRLADVSRELTEAGGTVHVVDLDVRDPAQWTAAADSAEAALGPVSILCSNAGISGVAPMDATPPELWHAVQQINLDGPFFGISTFLPRFKASGKRSHIMSTSSMAGLIPFPSCGAYVASKFGLVGLSLALRDELVGTEIGVSVLCPGTVATRLGITAEEIQADVLGREADEQAMRMHTENLSRGADPDRVGEQVVEAMQNRQFLIITHKEYEPLVRKVHDEIMQTYADFDGRHGVDFIPAVLMSGEDPVGT